MGSNVSLKTDGAAWSALRFREEITVISLRYLLDLALWAMKSTDAGKKKHDGSEKHV